MKSNSNVKIVIIAIIIIIFIVVVTLVSIYAFRKKDNYIHNNYVYLKERGDEQVCSVDCSVDRCKRILGVDSKDNYTLSLKGDEIQACSADKCKILSDAEIKKDILTNNPTEKMDDQTIHSISQMVKAMAVSSSETFEYYTFDFSSFKEVLKTPFSAAKKFVREEALKAALLTEAAYIVNKKTANTDRRTDKIDRKLDFEIVKNELSGVNPNLEVLHVLYKTVSTLGTKDSEIAGYLVKDKLNPNANATVVFNGTLGVGDTIEDLKFFKVKNEFGEGTVHTGFQNMYRDTGEFLKEWSKTQPKDIQITVVGHSAGSSMGIQALHQLNGLGFNNIKGIGLGVPKVVLSGLSLVNTQKLDEMMQAVDNKEDPVPGMTGLISKKLNFIPIGKVNTLNFNTRLKSTDPGTKLLVEPHLMKSYIEQLSKQKD